MTFNLLAVGDIVGDSGVEMLKRCLPELKKQKNIGFTVVNGENADGVGIHPRQADAIFEAGADVITLGNHTWNRLQIAKYLDSHENILRPANYASRVPGRGLGVYEGPGGIRIAVLNGITPAEAFQAFPYAHIAPDLPELQAWLDKEGRV